MESIKVLDTESSIFSAYKEYGQDIPKNFLAFYHGGLNALILRHDLMMIHFFDRQVHRGYGVFDTCNMFNRRIYLFDEHMSRFWASMKLASLQPPKTPKEIKNIMIKVAMITGLTTLNFRYWCSRGGKNLDIVTGKDQPTIFYLIATKGMPVQITKGLHDAYTVSTEVKGPYLSEIKTTNYLLNSLAAEEAAKSGGLGIMVTEDGYVTEAPVQSVGFVLKDKTYYAPPFYRALRSITQERVIELIQRHLLGKEISKISRKRRKLQDIKDNVAEMILLGGERIIPIRSWDGKVISDGIGPVTKEIIRVLMNDYSNPEVSYLVTETKL